MLKPCLHSDAEISIKGKDREEMADMIKAAVLGKPEMRDALDANNPVSYTHLDVYKRQI